MRRHRHEGARTLALPSPGAGAPSVTLAVVRPGHTPGSLVVFACVDGSVHALAGDIILSCDHCKRAMPPGSSWRPELIPEQMRLIARRANVIVPGHGAPFAGRAPSTGANRRPAGDRPGPGLGHTEES